MSSLSTDPQETTAVPEPCEVVGEGPIEIRTDARLAVGVGAIAAVVAIAYLTRAVGGGGWLDWVLCLVVGAIATAHLQSFADARVPLLVVDAQGVRLRRGRTWHGLPWQDIERVEHDPRRGPFRDGRVVLVPCAEDAPVLSVPLSLSTRVVGADGDLTAALERLALTPDQVVEIVAEEPVDAPTEDLADEPLDELVEEPLDEPVDEPVAESDEDAPHHPVLPDPRPTIARGLGFISDRLSFRRAPTGDAEPIAEPAASATPLPLRTTVTGIRSEVRFEGSAALELDHADDPDATRLDLPELDELRRPADALVIDDLVIDDLAPAPVADPVVGPELAAARARLALSVDQLAERTRIRPHVIESIEVDDFAPCGGDFYARGHLRTLARVLGVDAAPLLAAYDERYADAPIDARRVFESELATGTGGPIRSTRGGPNWSVLVAAVMALVLAWSIARLIMDSPIELQSKPVLNGSPSNVAKVGPPVPVVLDAGSGGAHVVVRDGGGDIVFNGDLAFGDTHTVKAAPPVRVQSSDGALGVTVDGQDRGPLGADGQPAQNTFAAAE